MLDLCSYNLKGFDEREAAASVGNKQGLILLTLFLLFTVNVSDHTDNVNAELVLNIIGGFNRILGNYRENNRKY